MRTTSPAKCDESALGQTDTAAALEHFATGSPLDPAVVERLRTRAAQITADIEREHGIVDDKTFQSLLDDEE
jgi:hypothetical protein